MKIVLLEDLAGKGKAGEIKEVSKGYAKNFLLPRGLASVATPMVIKQVESRLEREKFEESINRDKLVELAGQIEGKEIRLKARIGGRERLFGSITAADVAEELSRAIGSVIDKKKIDIEKPFRQTGSYEIAVKLGSDIKPKIMVVIEEEEETDVEEKKAKKEGKEKEKARVRAKEKGKERKKARAKAKEEEEGEGKKKEEEEEEKED
jgi:large subunit ribosomal protein L9